jgi:hypothetical protein
VTSADINEPSPANHLEALEEMARYGITRVPIGYFHYKEYRYNNLADAVAQAKRDEGSNPSARTFPSN